MIDKLNTSQTSYKNMTDIKEKNKNGSTEIKTKIKEFYKEKTETAAVYEKEEETTTAVKTTEYTVDVEKLQQMREETDARMMELFKDTAKGTGLKQLGGIRGILDKLRNSEKVTLEIEYTAEDVEQAKIDVAEGGYWSAKETSDRLVEFAKTISGGDSEKAEMLKDAFIKGFEEIKEMFGAELPELSENTYDLTIEKFENWANGQEVE